MKKYIVVRCRSSYYRIYQEDTKIAIFRGPPPFPPIPPYSPASADSKLLENAMEMEMTCEEGSQERGQTTNNPHAPL